jgi:DeoR family transcriptional regulator, aga operon transcriptional repressor
MIERARRVIVVTDSSKLGRIAFAQICSIDRVDELITDEGAPAALIGEFRDAGIAVTVA